MAASPGPLPLPPNLRLLLIVAVIIGLIAGAALWPKGGAPAGYYATKVVDFRQGRIQTAGCPTQEAKDVLGPPDNRYLSLGIGGKLMVELPMPARDIRDVTVYEVTGPSLFVPSRPYAPLVQRVGNGTIAFIQITASPAWPLGGEEVAEMEFDPASRTPDGFTRVIIRDQSQEPVKCVSGIDVDAVQVAPPPGLPTS